MSANDAQMMTQDPRTFQLAQFPSNTTLPPPVANNGQSQPQYGTDDQTSARRSYEPEYPAPMDQQPYLPTSTPAPAAGQHESQDPYAPYAPPLQQASPSWLPPLYRKIIRYASMLASLIGFITELVVAFSGAVEFSKYSSQTQKDSATATKTKKKEITAKSNPMTNTDQLLGGSRMTRLIKRTAEFERLPRAHSFDKRALQASQPSPQYALNTDVPLRGGAAGFTVISHVTVALLLAFLIWWEWQYLLGRPTKMGYWTPMLIGLLQLYVAIDLLGRNISKAAQGGAYLLLIMAMPNFFHGVYTGWTAHRSAQQRQQLMPMDQHDDVQHQHQQQVSDQEDMLAGPAQQPLAEPVSEKQAYGNQAPLSPSHSLEDQQPQADLPTEPLPAAQPPGPPTYSDSSSTGRPERPRRSMHDVSTGHRRAASLYSADIDSYYMRSPSLPGAHCRHRAYSDSAPRRRSFTPSMMTELPSPISLYHPRQQRKRAAKKARLRATSNATSTGVAGREGFRQTSQAIMEDILDEEDEEDDETEYVTEKDLQRASMDHFAARAKEAKKINAQTRPSSVPV